MAFKDLHKLKKITVKEKEFIQIPHLVVGKDSFAVEIYHHLILKYGKENVRLLSEDEILASDSMIKGPSTIRGNENKKVIEELFAAAEIKKFQKASIFYKDMSWKAFGGRSKPEALVFNEEFFCESRFEIELPSIAIDFSSDLLKIKSIEKKEDRFLVLCLNGTEFSSEKLYFGKSPYHYMRLFSDTKLLSNGFIQFCESTQSKSAIIVKFIFEQPISDIEETMFIPLSYTHEHGHFIGEFKTNNEKQTVEFIHFIDEDQISEDDVSRIIRQLKRSLEKIFEKFQSIKMEEFIAIEHEIGCLKIDDLAYNQCIKVNDASIKNLFFIGINAPITHTHCDKDLCEYSNKDVSFLARGILANKFLIEKI